MTTTTTLSTNVRDEKGKRRKKKKSWGIAGKQLTQLTKTKK